MKRLTMRNLASARFLLVFVYCACCFLPVAFWGYGLVLAFKASPVLGVVVLLLPPSPVLLGVVAVFGHPEVAQLAASWLGL